MLIAIGGKRVPNLTKELLREPKTNAYTIKRTQCAWFTRVLINECFLQVAAVQFSHSQNTLWRFENTRNAKYFKDQLADVSLSNGGRKRLSSLFSHIGYQTFSSTSGNRASVPDMVVIFTDAQSNDTPQSGISVS